MTASVRVSVAELQRLRQLANPPNPKAWHRFFCAVCDRPFRVQGISSLCPHCLSVAAKHGLSDAGEASGS